MRRLDGRAPAERGRPRRRGAALQRRPSARALGRDPRAAPAARACGSSAAPSERVRGARRRPRRHRPLRPAPARAGARHRGELRPRASTPRTQDQGIQAAKVGEFIGLGVPTVSYDYEVTAEPARDRRGRPRADAARVRRRVVRLAEDEAARAELGGRRARAGAALDWDVLARRYEDEVLDRYLPPPA